MIPLQLYYLLILTDVLVLMAGAIGFYINYPRTIASVLALQLTIMFLILLCAPYLIMFFNLA